MPDLVFTPLPGSSDGRGMSFSLLSDVLASMDKVLDVHIASVLPGVVRGNHYHLVKIELITVVHRDAWAFYWDTGEGTEVRSRQFDGTGAVAITVPHTWSHAVKNEGASELWLFNASDLAFEPGAPSDSQVRIVVQ
jgi:UDP-2-acetamido-2,6-beta-L-arabino-hexul-4-ose reductase